MLMKTYRLLFGLLVVGLLTVTACGGEEGSSGEELGSGDSSGDSNGSGSTDGSTDSMDSTNPDGSCNFDGIAAVKLEVDVSWGGGLAIQEGGGQLDIWFKANLDQDGNVIAVSGQPCNVDIPDFQTNALAGNEPIGTQWPQGFWSKPNMPAIDLQVNLASSEVGSQLTIPAGPMILGASMSDELNDPWPGNWSGVNAVDHDGDGKPGVTTVAKTGSSYGLPRLDIIDDAVRADQIYLAFRTILALDGVIDSCGSASGAATFTMEQHAVGCRVKDGDDCTTSQVDLLDSNMPQFQVSSASFLLKKVAASATCADILAALP